MDSTFVLDDGARTILKVRILLKADGSEAGESWTEARICEALDTNTSTVMSVRAKLVEEEGSMPCSRARSAQRRRWRRFSTASARLS